MSSVNVDGVIPSEGKEEAVIAQTFKEIITITFGEVAENHIGQQKIGKIGDAIGGLLPNHLVNLQRMLRNCMHTLNLLI